MVGTCWEAAAEASLTHDRALLSGFHAGDRVTYRGHAAVVVHPGGLTTSIRLAEPVRGMSRQLDVWTAELVKP